MPSLQPLIDKFAQEATPLNIVLLAIGVAIGWIATRWLRRVDALTDRVFEISEQSVRAGLANAEAERTTTEEARRWRDRLEAVEQSNDRLAIAVELLLERVEERDP